MILELEELLDDVATGNGDLLESDELANAVVNVDDQVLDLEIAQVRQERRGQRTLAAAASLAALLFEDVGFDIDL